MHFRQFDANSRKLAQGQGGVLRYVPAARVATLTQKSHQTDENAKARIGEANRATQTKKKILK